MARDSIGMTIETGGRNPKIMTTSHLITSYISLIYHDSSMIEVYYLKKLILFFYYTLMSEARVLGFLVQRKYIVEHKRCQASQ